MGEKGGQRSCVVFSLIWDNLHEHGCKKSGGPPCCCRGFEKERVICSHAQQMNTDEQRVLAVAADEQRVLAVAADEQRVLAVAAGLGQPVLMQVHAQVLCRGPPLQRQPR